MATPPADAWDSSSDADGQLQAAFGELSIANATQREAEQQQQELPENNNELYDVDSALLQALVHSAPAGGRAIVKSLEDSIIDFIANPEQDVLEFPLQLTTYQRMLAHKAAQHYGLQTTTTDYEGGVRVVAHRRATLCRQPRTRLSSLVVPLEVAYARSSGADKPRQLLRRPNGYERGDQRDIQRTGAWSAKSAKEREEEYARAKERIMGPMASESAPPAGPANGPSARGGRGAWGCPEHGGGMQPQLQAHNDALGPRGRAGRRGFARERSSEMQQDPDFMRGIHRYGPTAAFDPYAQPQQAAQAAPYPPGMQMYSIPTYQTAFPQMGPQGLMHMPQVPVPQLPVQAGVGSRGFPAYARQTPFSSQFNSSSNSSTTGGSMATYPISSAAAAAAGALPPSQASGHANHRPQQGASQQQHRRVQLPKAAAAASPSAPSHAGMQPRQHRPWQQWQLQQAQQRVCRSSQSR
ncbi:hypothetical protein V8C86DRAFT_253707 [Haematococcus lacustris]